MYNDESPCLQCHGKQHTLQKHADSWLNSLEVTETYLWILRFAITDVWLAWMCPNWVIPCFLAKNNSMLFNSPALDLGCESSVELFHASCNKNYICFLIDWELFCSFWWNVYFISGEYLSRTIWVFKWQLQRVNNERNGQMWTLLSWEIQEFFLPLWCCQKTFDKEFGWLFVLTTGSRRMTTLKSSRMPSSRMHWYIRCWSKTLAWFWVRKSTFFSVFRPFCFTYEDINITD